MSTKQINVIQKKNAKQELHLKPYYKKNLFSFKKINQFTDDEQKQITNFFLENISNCI